ncbi:MAG: glycosyltransferase family 9 protein [Flavobacteriales bacterium]
MRPSIDHIILSRTDSIGDVMLTLPMSGLLKSRMPATRITFLCRRYTLPVLRCCAHVDAAIALEDIAPSAPLPPADAIVHVFPSRPVARMALSARIPLRIGTSHRWWHWLACNRLVRFSRRRSALHEAQLNLKLLRPLGIDEEPSLEALHALSGFSPPAPDDAARAFLRDDRINVVLHPLSKGSAVEWGLERFARLIEALDPSRHHAIITGTASEADRYRASLPLRLPHVSDAGGRLGLHQLIGLIGSSQALVACSTGPLHIASACGIRAIGLYSPMRPIHPGRWGPMGPRAVALTAPAAGPQAGPRADIAAITVEQVLEHLPR